MAVSKWPQVGGSIAERQAADVARQAQRLE
jgi:hypothetical protein